MTARRVALLLAAGLAVIAFAMWMASRRHLERATRTGDPVLPGLERAANSVSEVDLARGDGTRTTLRKDSTGWKVAERGWPADTSRLRKLVLDLGALNIVEEKTRLPANYPQLGVEDVTSPQAAGTRIAAVAPGKTWALIIGKSSSGKSGYVRVAGAPQSLLAAPLLTPDADPKGWLDHTLIDLSGDRVREVEERPAGTPAYTATRVKRDAPEFTVSPLPKGRALAGPAAAEPAAAALSALTLEDVQRANAAAAHDAHAVFRTFDGLEVSVAGRKDGARSLITISARASDAQTQAEAQKLAARLDGWEFEIPEYRYVTIFRPLEELLQKPLEPASRSRAAKPG
ncbi:MAG: hypothetical protein PVSMB6_08270 [Steroidobacteraceae bacterium]